MNLIKRKTGFTLMEIMIVIIVIAVLASVAGPMIGNITDQGRASATRSKLANLKTALLAYKSDVGVFPRTADPGPIEGFKQGVVLSTTDEKENCLVCNSNEHVKINNYNKKWKGPYMDSEPTDFMYDSWGNPFWYVRFNHNLYLWSAGADGEYYRDDRGQYNADLAFQQQTNDENEECDDIVISVYKYKKALPGTDSIGQSPP